MQNTLKKLAKILMLSNTIVNVEMRNSDSELLKGEGRVGMTGIKTEGQNHPYKREIDVN